MHQICGPRLSVHQLPVQILHLLRGFVPIKQGRDFSASCGKPGMKSGLPKHASQRLRNRRRIVRHHQARNIREQRRHAAFIGHNNGSAHGYRFSRRIPEAFIL